MIEQNTITTTQKYNFPQPTIDTTLPQRFLEQSLHSLKQVQAHQPFQLNQQPIQQAEEHPSSLQLNRTPIQLKPNYQETTIAAIDTSTIKIGETTTGIIIAVRGATVWKQNRKYHYTRLGPFIFHITEENKNTVYNTLERAYFITRYESPHQSSPNLMQMPTRLASLLERWLQTMIAKTVTDGLILLDGSLTAGTIDTPVHRMREILHQARKNRSIVLAFSKATTLRVNGYLITDQLPNFEPPYLLETAGLRFKPPTVLQGDVYVAKLNKANYAFRLDIDREIPLHQRLEAVEKLVGNDLYTQGYPETLRLAHILCTFTANEVLAMQHFIARKHGIQLVNRPDMHRLLFGPFSKGDAYA
ncbi:DNA double-strand break repair nuclease NurA [Candidatus Bathyarchaeota archaeon A05DMB-2]|nr:DNA double-strand break repair nuclease NurA [Candidatus Bathyarchaeota archaeon A05DMB-2]